MLRTLAPALRELQKQLRAWLAAARRFPLSTLNKARLEGLAEDMSRQAQALDAVHPYLVVVLMGGTGVGKSTLLNALAGGAIAQASFQRPTTRDPVVYYHQSMQPHKLDAALQHCKLVSHDRPRLENKVLVDTPDLDSNDLSNRDKLLHLLPVADVILYVGSQEKYHDKLGWDLFLSQRGRHAFAFVLNKWDRCHMPGSGGVRPDEDLVRSLEKEGFQRPLLFRTNAQHWVDHPWPERNGQPPPAPLEGEQFTDLVYWLEEGLNRLEIESIKARGVGQLLGQVEEKLTEVCAPDLMETSRRVQQRWKALLEEEAQAHAAFLIGTAEPYQKEIEHHFALERQRKFRGLMGSYLQFFNKLRYSGSRLRDQVSLGQTGPTWDLSIFTQASTSAASETHLDSRQKALANRLLLEADGQGFPMTLLQDTTEETAKIDWRPRLSQAVGDVLGKVEHDWSQPSGARRIVQRVLSHLADWLPLLSLAIMGVLLIWQYTMEQRPFAWGDLLLPAIVMVLVMVVLHVVISVVMPLRWQVIRAAFETKLKERLLGEMERTFLNIPANTAHELLAERRQVEKLLGEIREVSAWLGRQEKGAKVDALYGAGNGQGEPGGVSRRRSETAN